MKRLQFKLADLVLIVTGCAVVIRFPLIVPLLVSVAFYVAIAVGPMIGLLVACHFATKELKRMQPDRGLMRDALMAIVGVVAGLLALTWLIVLSHLFSALTA